MNPPPRPSVFEYLDQHLYLVDWYDWQKQHNRAFSHRSFQKRTGLAVGYLTNLLKARRVPEGESLDRLIVGMGLSEEEAGFFRLLIRLQRASDWRSRTDTLAEIFNHPAFERVEALQARRLEYLSRWYYVAIRELEQIPGFREDVAWIRDQLRFPVSDEEIAAALQKIRRLRHGESASPRLTTPAEVEGAAVVQYHQGMIRLSLEALDRIPHMERHFAATTIAVPPSMVPKIKAEIQRFIVELANLSDHLDPDTEPERVLLQVQTQMFPLGGQRPG